MVIVARDGSGDARSIQEAVDRIAAANESDRRILVKPGTYQERVIIHSDRIHILGEDAESTIITALGCAKDPDENGQEKGTFLSYTVMVAGNDVTLENLTIRNDAGDGRKVGQAVALYTAGDRGRFLRCRLIAHQDTLFCGPLMPKVAQDMLPYQSSVECVPSVGDCPLTYGREYFEQCYIRGDVDFIFGPYRCWFERCTLFMNCRGGWYTAANTPEEQPYGFVFHRCELTGECEEGAAWLGRPWRKYARTVFLQCDMDAHVSPGGFADWDENRLVTERLGEWGTTGARQDLSTRHPRQKRMTEAEAEGITFRGAGRQRRCCCRRPRKRTERGKTGFQRGSKRVYCPAAAGGCEYARLSALRWRAGKGKGILCAVPGRPAAPDVFGEQDHDGDCHRDADR